MSLAADGGEMYCPRCDEDAACCDSRTHHRAHWIPMSEWYSQYLADYLEEAQTDVTPELERLDYRTPRGRQPRKGEMGE